MTERIDEKARHAGSGGPALLRRNLQSLSGSQPDMTALLQHDEESSRWIVHQAVNGAPTAFLQGPQGERRYIHSTVDPGLQCDRWAALAPAGDGPLVVLGLGLGYPALALERQNPGRPCIFVERDRALFRLALSRLDLRPVLSHPRFHFLTDEEPEGVIRYLHSLRLYRCAVHAYPPVTELDPGYYGRVESALDAMTHGDRARTDPGSSRAIELLFDCMTRA